MTLTLIVFGLLLVLGIPIGYVMGFSAMLGLFTYGGGNPAILNPAVSRLESGTSGYVLVAVPFFILVGEFLNRSGMTQELIDFAQNLIGHIPGGLSHVNIGVSILFAGLTGTAVTDTVAIGKVLIPSMKREGYDADYSAAVTAASSVIGPIIPPSVVMVVYATILRLSVPALFAAAITPGLLCGTALLILSWFLSKKRDYPRRERASLKEVVTSAGRALLALLTGVIIIGGILFGITTVTEAAVAGAFYALLVGALGYRELDLNDIWESFLNTVRLSGVIFLLIGAASALSWFTTLSGLIVATANLFTAISSNPLIVLTLVDAFILIVCMFIDVIPAALILGPVLSPAMVKIGINPVHFAMIMMLGLNIGNATPPMGMTLMTASRIAEIDYEESFRDGLYFIAVEVAALLLVTYVPILSLWAPRMLGF